jgi:hypothetical protein
LLVKAEDGRSDFTGPPGEGPARFVDFSTKSMPIEIFDQSPARCAGLTFDSHDFRQECALLDQDGPPLDGGWHFYSFSASTAAHCLAATVGGGEMFPLDSIFITGGPSSRLPHVIFRCRGTDPFVFFRLSQFSNNFTGHVERGPRLALESHRFRQKSAFLNPPCSRIDCVWHWHLRRVLGVAQDCHARSFTVTRLAGVELLSTS